MQSAFTQTDRIQFYYGIAEGNYLIGDLNGAQSSIEQMLRIDPNHIPALTLQARIYLDQGKATEALDSAERAVELEPEKLEHTLLKALILGNMDRRDEATAIIESVITRASPGSDDAKAAQQLLGLLRMAEGRWDEAAEAFNSIYLNDPATAATSLRLSSEAYLEKARSELGSGEYDSAIDAIDQAIAVYEGQTGTESFQQRTTLRMMRARLLSQLGRTEEAIKDLQLLTGQQPENFEALITLASLYASVDRWESVEALIPEFSKRPQLLDIALYLEGRAALAKNRVGSARAKFEAAIEALPDAAESLRRTLHFYRGVCLERLDRKEEAETDILNAINAGFQPETGSEALTASRILLRVGRPADAIPLLESITLNRINPDFEVWAMLGRANMANGSTTLAISAFNESLSIEPDQAETRALRGSLLRKIGDFEGALADYEAALLIAPQNISIMYAIGLVKLQLGKILEAEQAIGLSARQLPDQPSIQLLHALLAYSIGSHNNARESLKSYMHLIAEERNENALYLDHLLNDTVLTLQTEVSLYLNGEITEKDAIDRAGIAQTPEQAQQQISATTFWMAQYAQKSGKSEQQLKLLEICLQMGNPDMTEYQLAKWQSDKLNSTSE